MSSTWSLNCSMQLRLTLGSLEMSTSLKDSNLIFFAGGSWIASSSAASLLQSKEANGKDSILWERFYSVKKNMRLAVVLLPGFCITCPEPFEFGSFLLASKTHWDCSAGCGLRFQRGHDLWCQGFQPNALQNTPVWLECLASGMKLCRSC